MRTKRSDEAYVMIDHRNSPGVTPEFIRDHKLDAPAVGAGQFFESAINCCGHCNRDIILNPNRTRERGWCWSCDKYICDDCTAARQAGTICVPYKARMAIMFERLIKGLSPTSKGET